MPLFANLEMKNRIEKDRERSKKKKKDEDRDQGEKIFLKG
jgi:hypothetical protein